MDPQKSTAPKLWANRIHAEPSIRVESYAALKPAAQRHLQITALTPLQTRKARFQFAGKRHF